MKPTCRQILNAIDSIVLHLGTPPMTDAIEGVVDTLYEMRLETLLSVDDLVTAVVNALEVNQS